MILERALFNAQNESLAILGQVTKAYEAISREKASGGMYGNTLTAENVAVGDYAMTNAYQYGRSAQDERQLIHYRGWNYSSIKPIAVTIAGQPVRVARKTARGRPSPKRTVKAATLGVQNLPRWIKAANPQSLDVYEDHPILDVFDEPNDIMTKWHLLYTTVVCLQLCGKCHWWLTTNKETGKPCIWPIPPSWIQPVHTKEKAFDSWLLMPGGTGQPVPIPRDEIVYFFYPDPGNPLGVVSPMSACGRMVVADDAIWEAQSRTFRQGIWPGLAVIAGEYIDEDGEEGGRPLLEREQRQQIYTAIRRAWGGVMNMSEPLILDALIKDIKKITNTPAEMDFMESSKMTKAAIQQTHGTNPSIMGEIEGLNRATAIAGRWNFADFVVNPLIQMISETLTFSIAKALAEDDEKLFLWIEPYHPDDQSERRANYTAGAQIGAKIRQDEARTLLLNLPPLGPDEGGDEFCQPAQKPGGPGQPKGAEDAATAGVPNPDAGSDLAPQDQDSKINPGDENDSATSDLGGMGQDKRKRIAGTKAPSRIRQTSIERRDRRKRRQALYLKAHARHEGKLVPILKGFFHEQSVSCMEGLAKVDKDKGIRNAKSAVHAIFDGEAWTKRLKQSVKPLLHKAMATAAAGEWASAMLRNTVAVKATDIDDILIDLPDEIREEIASALDSIIDADFWDDVSETTKAALVESLEEGIENNESLYELCCRIGDDPTVAGVDPGIFPPGSQFGTNPVLGNGPSTARAKLIARTETTGAMNRGHLAAIDSLVKDGIATGKSWSALDDAHTREAHVEADAEYGRQNPIAIDEPFILHDDVLGDVEAIYPGDINLPPSQRCNCRCLAQSVFPEDAEPEAAEGEDEPSDTEITYEEAGMEDLTVNVIEYVMKALGKDFDPDKHPRAADGKFGAGGGEAKTESGKAGDKPAAKPGKVPKTMAELHSAADHAKAAIAKAVDVTKYTASAVAAAGKHVKEKVQAFMKEHPKTSKVIISAAVVAASEAVLHLTGFGELSGTSRIGMLTALDLCSDRIKDFASAVIGLAEKSLDADPTDADLPEIMRAGKKLWDDIVSSFDVPKDAIKDAKAWDESAHPRGQPGNAGQFGSGGGGAKDDDKGGKDSGKSDSDKPEKGGGKGKSEFDAEKFDAMPLFGKGSRRDAWGALPEEERDRQADAPNTIPARQAEHLKGLPEVPDTGKVDTDIDARVKQMSDRLHPQAMARLQIMAHGMADDLKAAGAGNDVTRRLAMAAVDSVAAQEIEAAGRSLGDHGTAHILGDIKMAHETLDAAGQLTPMNKAVATVAMAFHDAGYLAPPSQHFLDEGHHRWGAQSYEEHLQKDVAEALGKPMAGKIGMIIRTHDDTTMDWQKDPTTAACRLADNLALFSKEKSPPCFRYVPKNLDVFTSWANKEITFADAKKQAAANVEAAKIPEPLKARIRDATTELSEFGAGSVVGMAGGYVKDIGWSKEGGGHPVVRVEESEVNGKLNKLGDHGQDQFAKLAKTYHVDPKQFLTDLNFSFADPSGKVVLEGVMKKIKAWMEYLIKHCNP